MIKAGLKILCVFAHHEDHIIFGWPIFQDHRFKRFLLTCSWDAQDVVSEGCKRENVTSLGTVGIENGFSYRVEKPIESYKVVLAKIQESVEKVKPDYIFTHNPMGEYGHLDHQFLFKLIYNEFPQQQLLVTDILIASPAYPEFKIIPRLFKHLYEEKIEDAVPDIEFYKRNTRLFDTRGVWDLHLIFNLPEYPREGFSLFLIDRGG